MFVFSFLDASVSCDFSAKYMCGYENTEQEGLVWKRYKGSTPSPNSGPDIDHTATSPDGTDKLFIVVYIQTYLFLCAIYERAYLTCRKRIKYFFGKRISEMNLIFILSVTYALSLTGLYCEEYECLAYEIPNTC